VDHGGEPCPREAARRARNSPRRGARHHEQLVEAREIGPLRSRLVGWPNPDGLAFCWRFFVRFGHGVTCKGGVQKTATVKPFRTLQLSSGLYNPASPARPTHASIPRHVPRWLNDSYRLFGQAPSCKRQSYNVLIAWVWFNSSPTGFSLQTRPVDGLLRLASMTRATPDRSRGVAPSLRRRSAVSRRNTRGV